MFACACHPSIHAKIVLSATSVVPAVAWNVVEYGVRNTVLTIGMKFVVWTLFALLSLFTAANATPYTRTVPATGVALPTQYPEAGGVAIVMTGTNGNIYYQFSDPAGAFKGFNNNGTPVAFRGNPFTINNPIVLDCGFSPCATYFGGAIARIDIRFSAYDGDTQPGGFDENDISLRLNGFNLGSWSGIATERTDNAGTTSFGMTTGFGNNTFNTAWFSSTNPALLNNILTTGSTTTQVFDSDPNDNYWDFTRGTSLGNAGLQTIAPGYTMAKTAHSGSSNGPLVTTFSAVGDTVFFEYIVTNIGSVQISNLAVSDDKVSPITCDKTTIVDVPSGSPSADFATCTGTYVITQADLDAQSVTNIASATGTPQFGQLGALTDTVTLTGPPLNPVMTLDKVATPDPFGAVGSTVTYNFTITNTGNTTLSNVSVADPNLPGLVCSFAQVLPLSTENAVNTQTCSGTYLVSQADVDAFATAGTNLANTATVSATDPTGAAVSATGSSSIPGQVAAPAMTVAKSAAELDYSAVGDVLNYNVDITNTGNVTFPAAPTVTDVLTGGVTCPAGAVAPGATVSCTASYTIQQSDLDARSVTNTADVSITVGGQTASGTASVTTNAVVTTGLDIVKQLQAASPVTFSATGTALTYEYVLTNSGTVTLQGASVTDDKVAVTCPATDIAPGASITCTSDPYPTTQADLDAGDVTNTATASTTAAGGAEVVTSPSTSLAVPADQQPAMTVTKTAPAVTSAQFAPGLVVTYSYEVANTGNVSITDQITVTDDHIAGAFNCGTQNAGAPLAVGATVTCTADYTVSAQDVADGAVTNIASASDGTTTSPTDTATIPQSGTPALSVVKTATEANFTTLADTLHYTFTVTNSGDTNIVDLTPISISDSLIAAVDCSAQPATLAPGASFDCTASYTPITQAQMDAGEVVNTATASFQYTGPGGGVSTITSPSSTATVPANVTPALTLVKSVAPTPFTALNQTLTYTFAVTNDGAQTLTSVDVTDPLLGGAVCTLANVAPGASDSCTGTYQVTQADMDAGSISNTATASGTTPTGGTANDTDTLVTPLDPAFATKSMTLSKTADVASFAAVGDVITYTFEVQNTGTQTLTAIAITDPLFAALNCSVASLAPGASDQSCTASYTVDQDDIDAGSRANTATATAAGATDATSSVTVPGPARNAALVFGKSAAGGYTAAGDTVTFTMSVQNTGNVRLNGVTVTDAFFTPAMNCAIGTIDPGATDTSCTGTYTVTQADVDAGSITNTAAVTGTGADGTVLNDTASEVVNGPAEAPSISIVKTEQDGTGTFGALPATETYLFAVQNTGNVTLTNIVVTDPLTGFSCTVADLAPGATAPSCSGGAPLQETVTVTQAHIDAGNLANTASVAADSTQGTPVTDSSTVVLTGPARAPAITLAKTASAGNPFSAVGDVVSYDYVVTNSGNITLTAPVSITDDKIAVINCPAPLPGGLAPGATVTCTATYTISQADLDAGSVTNTAHGETSALGAVIVSPDDSETALATQTPQLSILKRVKPGTAATYGAPNDTVTFEYVVTNTGNVTTTAPATISDDKIPGLLTCAPAGLAPAASATCEQDWTATQADLDAGSVTNIAAANTTFGGAPVASGNGSVTIYAVQDPSLAITKSIVAPIPATYSAGLVLHYQYVVTNDGNVTINQPVTVSDNLTAVVCDPLPVGGLLPAGTLNCIASYTITTGDISLGSVTNIATANSSFGGQPVASPSANAIFPVAANPALSIAKTAISGANFSAVGDVISYRFTVTNSGGADLSENITVNDPLLGGVLLCHDTAASGIFAVNDVAVCDAAAPVANPAFDYAVTQADLDRGFVTNEATATTTFAPGTPNQVDVVSPSSTTTVNAATSPALTVAKAVTAGPNPADLNDVLTYTITTTNSGNQTISGIVVSDPLLPVLSCTVGGIPAPANITLAPTEQVICTGNYTVTQADLDTQDLAAPVVSNTATAAGSNPQGGPVSNTGSTTHPLVASNPSVSVSKAFTNGVPAFTDVGETVEFTITVTNTGNVTLASTEVTDNLVPGTCSIGALAPGAVDTTCTFTYAITQADIDNAGFTNTATAVSQPAVPGAPTVTDDDSVTGNGPAIEPQMTLVKTAGVADVNTVGQVVTYSYIVLNTGNVTAFGTPSVTDDKIGTFNCGAIGAGGLGPNQSVNCTADYTVTQADVDAGIITNTATVGGLTVTGGGAVPVSDPVSETVDAIRTPGVSVSKTASQVANVAVGTVVTYTYDVTNTGNVTLTNVTPDDQHTSASGTVALAIAGDSLLADNGVGGNSTDAAANGVWDTLGPGDVVRFTASYTVTQPDVDSGAPITNTVTVTTTAPAGTVPPTATDNTTVQPEVATPAIEVLKTVSAQSGSAAGDTVTFEVSVANTGNVTIDGISTTDTLKRNDNTVIAPAPTLTLQSGDNGVAGDLEVGETWVYQTIVTLTQADIDAGGINNSVLADGSAPNGDPVSDVSDNGAGGGSTPTTVVISPAPALQVLKVMSAAPTTVGATVGYDITVLNSGNVTMGSVSVSSDTLTRADGTALALTSGPTFVSADAGSAAGALKVGETATYHATYVLTQADVDAGGIVNSAVAIGTPPVGGPVTDTSDDGTGGPGGSTPTTLAIAAAPSMALVKAASDPSFNTLGQVLTYTFTLTNTGNVTLVDPFTVTDPMITDAGGTITCAAPPLAPNATLDCTGNYSVTQADLDAGVINNSASISDGTTTSPPATASVPAVQTPAMEVAKVADPIAPADFIVGATVTYTYTVTNTGNVTLTDPITITDNLIAPADITCPAMPAAGVAPLATYVCNGTYTVTANDVALASATNLASASDGTTTSPNTSETVPSGAVPALTIAKAAISGADFTAVGDQITYEYTVTNSGSASFATPVVVNDDKFATPITCFDPAGPAGPDLIPGEVVTCSAVYDVTQDDLDAGFVTNQANAQTLYAGTTDVVSPPQSVTVNAATTPELTVTKSAATLPITGVGQVLTYTVNVENTGNQTLTNISASDPLIPALVCNAPDLAPAASIDCTGTYTVQQSDIDAGTLLNTATATAVDPQGGAVTDTGSLTLTTPAATPSLVFSKSASPSPFGAVGSAVTYTFAVQNTGNVTLLNTHVTDALAPAYDCTIASIAPGTTDNSCTLSLTVTQDDVDAGEIVNNASVAAVDPFGTPVTGTATITTPGPARVPALEATKTAAVAATSVGTVVPYTLAVENTGNVSITVTGITDSMARENGTLTALDVPFALASGDADADGLLDVGEIWIYAGSHTITQADINAGGFHNSATVNGTGPGGTPVSDVSDNGNDADGNTTDDATPFPIIAAPSLVATKVIETSGSVAGDTVSFVISAINNGNVTVAGITVADTLTRADGTVLAPTTGPVRILPSATDNGDNTHEVSETLRWRVTYVLTQDDIDAGGISNTATVSGTAPNGDPVSDVSDNGDNGDGNTVDDPTVLAITPAPALDVVKAVTSVGTAAGEEVVFTVSAANTGNVTLTGVTIADTMSNLDGTPLTPASVTYTGALAGTLTVGETGTWEVRYTMTQADVDAGGVQNSVVVTGTTPAGGTISDTSDDGDDADGNAVDDPTVAAILAVETVSATKIANTPTRIRPDVFQVTFTITVENTGNVTQRNMQVVDDLTAFVAPATLLQGADAPVLQVSGFTGGAANGAYDGAADANLLSGAPELAPGDIGTVQIIVTYDTGTGSPAGVNTAVVTADRLSAAVTASAPVVTPSAAPDILATKSVSPANAKRGDSVTYTMTFQNRLATAEAGLTFVDQMPAGLVFTPGTATYNGAATPTPVQAGRQLSWPGITLAPGETVTITLKARVTGGGGKLVNRAYVLDSFGNTVSNLATAILKVAPEHIFDCSDIIGKVFDDKDMDGYQDQGEPGLAGVRLATVRGVLITTDAYGRYHVPCAELPAGIGSNFTLKLDTRTLPSGYRVTTENPRVIRVTAGKFARLNFGAALSNVVDVDLTALAFDPDDGKPTKALEDGVKDLVARLRSTPSVVRLSYYRDNEDERLAKDRLKMVEELLRKAWRGQGRYRLLIERTIKRVQ